GINDEARTLNILDRSVKGEVREWYHREFDNKNWELQNVLDNSAIGAGIANIRGANAGAITAGGRPTNAVPVTPNAGGVPPKNMEQILDTYESANPFPDTLTREEIMRVVAKAYGPPPKPQKPEKLQSSRIDRLESKIDEIAENEITTKLKEIQALQSEIKELEMKYFLAQKDLSEIDSLRRELVQTRQNVELKNVDLDLKEDELSEKKGELMRLRDELTST
ncbi:19125_t:CDS:2, partial [Funneliformis geosporum]